MGSSDLTAAFVKSPEGEGAPRCPEGAAVGFAPAPALCSLAPARAPGAVEAPALGDRPGSVEELPASDPRQPARASTAATQTAPTLAEERDQVLMVQRYFPT